MVWFFYKIVYDKNKPTHDIDNINERSLFLETVIKGSKVE